MQLISNIIRILEIQQLGNIVMQCNVEFLIYLVVCIRKYIRMFVVTFVCNKKPQFDMIKAENMCK